MADQPSLPEDRDVEDVLSSIRKLVSAETEARLTESQRAFARRVARNDAPKEPAQRPNGDAKPLFLSTALRVDDGKPETAPEATKAESVLSSALPETNDDDSAEAGGEPLRLVPSGDEQSDDVSADAVVSQTDDVPDPSERDHSEDLGGSIVPAKGSRLTLRVPQEPVEASAPQENDLADVALRELVRSVIREELEGEIGDRISRNLTLYVRKEVAKAMRVDPSDV